MRHQPSPSEQAARRAARLRGLFVSVISLGIGLLMLLMAESFLAMHCLIAAAVALSGGIAAGRAALPLHSGSARSAGAIGGVYATLGYALPFMVHNFLRWVNTNEETVALRMAQMTPQEIAQAQQWNITIGVDYFRGQDIAYLFGYLLFALLFGWALGVIGGALAQRQMQAR
ncbi:MAG: hypothetical protein NZ532_03180 [Thermoflexales bacterium]|nr:hypothetical protein [Thermoflexales bacterium]